MNLGGAAVGTWDSQGFVRWADGGVFRFDIFPDPRDDGGSRYLLVRVESLNEHGAVVGSIAGGNFYGRAFAAGFYWDADGGVLLRNQPGQPLFPTHAQDINDAGVIVGWCKDGVGATTACTWAGPSDPPAYLAAQSRFDLTEAHAINDKGLIVGHGIDSSDPTVPIGFESFGIIWWKGKAYVLDALFEQAASLHIERVLRVNNQDRIAGTARRLITPADGGAQRSIRYPIVIDVLGFPE